MKFFRTLISFIAVICITAIPALADSEFTMAGYDPEDVYRSWESNLFFERMEERSGISFNFNQFTDKKAWQDELKRYKSGENLPDVLFKAELSPAMMIELYSEGVIIDLKPYLAEHAPNLWKLLNDNPEYMEETSLPTGEIVALPHIDFMPLQNCMWVNTKWLNRLGLSMPEDRESFTEMLIAFKNEDPNGNGSSDEIPLSFIGAYDLKYLAHAFGIVANDFNIYEKDGKAYFAPLDNEFRNFIKWLRELYDNKLLDEQGFFQADMLRRVTDAKSTQKYGVLICPIVSQVLPQEWSKDYSVIPPLEFEGNKIYRRLSSPVTSGTFAITSKCESPETMLKWVDYLYSLDGAILASEGVENIDYVIDGDGSWRKTASAQSADFLSRTAITTGAAPPGITSTSFQDKFFDDSVRHITQQIKLMSDYVVSTFPPINLSFEQEDELIPMQDEIGRYVDESIARWVIGEWNIDDESFKEFESGLRERQLESFMAFWQQLLYNRKEAI